MQITEAQNLANAVRDALRTERRLLRSMQDKPGTAEAAAAITDYLICADTASILRLRAAVVAAT